jgi:bifunctional DNA-binding transcriptional regulator/antitoxin component of YhaV-PrlF toxin-antitoxin module
MEDATMTSKSQVTVPCAVREARGVLPGDKTRFVPRWRGFRLVVLKGDIRSISGVLRGRRNHPVSIAEVDSSISRMGRLSGEQVATESQRRTRRA